MSDITEQPQAAEEQQQSVEANTEYQNQEQMLPNEVSDRTKEQFEKLTQNNKDLKEKMDKLQAEKDVLQSLYPSAQQAQTVNPSLINNTTENLITEDGYVDVNKLNKALADAQKRAEAAERKAQAAATSFETYTQTEQVSRAHAKHPYLDPNNPQFDRKFYDLTKNELIGQMMNGQKDVMLAADKVAQMYKPQPVQKEEQSQKVKQENNNSKSQMNAGRTGSGQIVGTYQSMSNDDLIARQRKGDRNALAERLKRSGF